MIEKYIRQLLEKHDEVTVPELGTFKAIYSSAQIRGNEIAPPNKKILFDEDAQVDTSYRLQKTMMEAEYISQEDFDEQLRVFLTSLKAAIDDKGDFLIKGLGNIVKAPDGSLSFSQDEAANFLADTFGLSTVSADPTVARTVPNEDVISTSVPEEGKGAEEEVSEEETISEDSREEEETPVAPPVEEDNKEEPQPEAKEDMVDSQEESEKKKKSDLVAWLVIIPLVTIFAFLLYVYINRDDNEELQALLDQTQTEQPVQVEAEDSTPQAPDDNANGEGEEAGKETSQGAGNETTAPVQESTSTESTPTPPPTASQNTGTVSQEGVLSGKTGRFYILIGSYSSLEKAQAKRSQLGADAVIIPAYPSVNNYRVASESFTSEREAYNRRNELRAGDYPSAWVLEY